VSAENDSGMDPCFRSRLRAALVSEIQQSTRKATSRRIVSASMATLVAGTAVTAGLVVAAQQSGSATHVLAEVRAITATCSSGLIVEGEPAGGVEVPLVVVGSGESVSASAEQALLDVCGAAWEDGSVSGVELQGAAPDAFGPQTGGALTQSLGAPALSVCDAQPGSRTALVVVPAEDCETVGLRVWNGVPTQ
jgi:hypothetical protein